jgi:MATE family multidrug resistance protein
MMNKQILRLAIPNILSNLTVPLLSSVDTALVGHLEQVSYLGGIAVGGMIFNFIYWGFGFLRMGTTGLTAQAYGQRNETQTVLILLRALLVAVISGVILIVIHKGIAVVSFQVVETTFQVEKHARIYFNIRILSAPATLALYAFTGWFLGMQNAKYPLIIALVTNCLNIIFNLFFIKKMGMNVNGVALGTVCANYLGLLVAIYLFRRSYFHTTREVIFKDIFYWNELKKFFTLNRDILIRTLTLIFAFSFFTAKSAEEGDIILACNTILINLWTIMSYGIDGFAFAAESLIGRYFGAHDQKRLQKAVRYTFAWGVGLGLAFTLIYALFSHPILNIFTDNQLVLSLTHEFMIWTIIAPLISSFCYIWDGIFIGATAGPAMRNAMIISLVVFYLPAYYIFHDILGNHGLWLALTLFMISRSLTMSLFYKKHVLARVA